MRAAEHFDTIVVGGGQAGLTMGHELQRLGRHFVILDAHPRVGDAWRQRWDSLKLFTPRFYSGLDGLLFEGKQMAAPTKDEVADYLERYRDRFDLPVRTGVRVTRIFRDRDELVVEAGETTMSAGQVVVATGAFQHPWKPLFAEELDPDIRRLHSFNYRNSTQLKQGSVLLVGAGNSGADIAMDLARERRVWLSGRHPGHVPFRIEGHLTRYLIHVVRFVGHHLLNQGTPIGRKLLPKLEKGGDPLVRVKPKDLLAAGVERVPRVAGVKEGLPMLEDGRVLDPANVIWCTGFRQDFSWIELPIHDEHGRLLHDRGVVASEPGLYFLGLEFQYGVTSDVLTGVRRDARFLADHIAARQPVGRVPVAAAS